VKSAIKFGKIYIYSENYNKDEHLI